MDFSLSVPLLAYLATAVFVVGVVLRAAKYARAPMHLRWELYPIPHEKNSHYGGSYFEELDWWSRPRETSLAREIKAMLEEMLLIRSLWHHNRAHWYASFPFHFGLYLLIGFVVLLSLTAGAENLLGKSSVITTLLAWISVALGAVGLVLSSLGTTLLLYRRLTDPVLKSASSAVDYFNLYFLLIVLGAAGLAWVTTDPTFTQLRACLVGLLSLSPTPAASPAVALEVALVSLFMIYMPFTHMTHFVAKYFTFHQVRWDDRPNLGEADIQAKIMENLGRPVGWSAPHIPVNKSWAETATEVE